MMIQHNVAEVIRWSVGAVIDQEVKRPSEREIRLMREAARIVCLQLIPGYRIRVLRLRAGWTLRELARRAGVDPAYLSRLESGKKNAPSTDVLDRLDRAMAVSE